MTSIRPSLLLPALVALASTAPAEDWTHFLGPRYDFHSAETGLELLFPETGPRLLWEIERGRGHAGPVVAGDHVVFIHQVGDQEEIRSVHPATGETRWKHAYAVETGHNFGVVDAPRSSPVIDLETRTVFTFGNDGDLVCLKLDTGEPVWQLSVPDTFGEGPFFFGYGSSPVIHGDRLIVNVGSEDVCVAAFDKKTGAVVWKTDHAWHGSYASPIVAEIRGKECLLVFTGGQVKPPTGGLLCLDPVTGAIHSEFPWRSDNFASVNAASPVMCGENRVFISEDYGLGGVMVEYDEALQPSAIWTSPTLGCQFQTPIYHQGTLYGVGGNGGLMMAYDAASGRPFWNEAFYQTTIPWQGRPISISLGHAHLIHVDGAFLCLSEDGALLRLELGPGGFEILAKARLFYAPETWAPPVVSGGRLFVTKNEMGSKLFCYDLKAPADEPSN